MTARKHQDAHPGDTQGYFHGYLMPANPTQGMAQEPDVRTHPRLASQTTVPTAWSRGTRSVIKAPIPPTAFTSRRTFPFAGTAERIVAIQKTTTVIPDAVHTL